MVEPVDTKRQLSVTTFVLGLPFLEVRRSNLTTKVNRLGATIPFRSLPNPFLLGEKWPCLCLLVSSRKGTFGSLPETVTSFECR